MSPIETAAEDEVMDSVPHSDIYAESSDVADALSGVLQVVSEQLTPGIRSQDIEVLCESEIRRRGYQPVMKSLNGFPAHACVSRNNQVLHGIPNRKRIKASDIVSVQTALRGRTAYANQGWTFAMPKVSEARATLLEVVKSALAEAVELVRPGVKTGEIGACIQSNVEAGGYSVVREYCGYAMGEEMFQEPQILCYGKPDTGSRIRAGMILNIQVIAVAGKRQVKPLSDNWTVVTEDRRDGVVFSSMVRVTKHGGERISSFIT